MLSQVDTIIMYINRLKDKNLFVETGTNTGDMIDVVRGLFKEIYSVEVNCNKWRETQERFKYYPNIHILNGNSGDIIPKEADLYWLDAHYAPPKANCPILAELNRIDKFKYILIDDYGLMNGKDGFPQAAEIETLIREKWNIFTYEKLGQVTVIDWDSKNELP